MSRTRKPSLRSCVGCARTTDKRELVRIVRSPDSHIFVDASGKANGRGAYLCAQQACFDAAVRRKRFDSALRVHLQDDDIDRVRREFDDALRQPQATLQGR